jgi:hypothetical protein
MKEKLLMGAVFAFTALFSLKSGAQECDKGVTVYFDLAQKQVKASDKARLDSLNKAFKELKINYVEIAGHADQKGSDAYNLKLAGERERTVKTQLMKGNFPKNAEVREFNFGESKPKYTTGDETILGKNRRVEIYFAQLENGKLVLAQPSGSSVRIDKNFFGTCGLCGSFASVTELKSADEAASNGIPLKSDGSEYSTVGMIKFHFDCDKQKEACTMAEIRVAASSAQEGIQLYEYKGLSGWTARPEEVKYDATTNSYIVNANICSDVWFNLGKEEERMNTINIKLPKLTRENDASVYIGQEEDAQKVELRRNGEGFTTQCLNCMDNLTLSDSGVADNGFVYYYAGDLRPALVRTDKKTNYYELSLDSYKPVINYSDSVIIVKIPKKYATKVKMYIPTLDSSLAVRHYEKSETKFRLKKPSHDFALTMQPDKNTIYRVEDENLKIKYKKSKRLYYAKIKKKDLIKK